MAYSPWFFALFTLFALFSCTGGDRAERQTVAAKQDGIKAVQEDRGKKKYDFSALQSGDIILKHGRGWVSRRIVQILHEKEKISHCGLVIRQKDSLFIIHSVAREVSGSDGVQTISLKKFIRDTAPGSLRAVRLKAPADTRRKMAEEALKYLSRKTPFDYDYDYTSDDKIYCSELVYRVVLNASGEDCFRKKICNKCNMLMFNSLLDTAYFKPVGILH